MPWTGRSPDRTSGISSRPKKATSDVSWLGRAPHQDVAENDFVAMENFQGLDQLAS